MTDLAKAGKYEILAKIGEGGFGVVYKGRDPFLKRLVAIKTCETDDEELRRRFFREAEIAGRLQHPNITTVHDFGFQDGTPYLVQEYLSGQDLDRSIKAKLGIPLEIKVQYLIQIAQGLEYAHQQGVTHRDVKPGNIRILRDGRVKIMDFGIAKLASAESQLTRAGTALGTPAYLPPEQIRGEEVDQRADIYAWAVLAFELLTFQRPFDGKTISALFYQKLHEEPKSLLEVWPDCPLRLEGIIARCIEREPPSRPADFGQVVAELEELLNELEETQDDATLVLPASMPKPEVKKPAGKKKAKPRQEAVRKARDRISKLLAEGSLEKAQGALSEAEAELGKSASWKTLRKKLEGAIQAVDDQERTKRKAALEQVSDRIAKLLDQGSLEAANTALGEAEAEFGETAPLTDLRQRLGAAVIEAQQERERREAALDEAMKRISKLLGRGSVEAAFAALAKVEAELGDSETLHALRNRIEIRQAKQQQEKRRRALEEGKERISQLLEEGSLEDAALALSEAESELGDSEALQTLRQQLERLLHSLKELVSRGQKLLQQERWQEAIDVLEQALQIDPEGSDAQALLAEARGSLERQKEEAERARALQQAVIDVEACLDKKDAEKAEKALSEARQRFGEASELEALDERLGRLLAETRARALVVQGEDLVLNKKFDPALVVLKEILSLDPDNSKARELLATTEAGINRRELRKARQERKKAIVTAGRSIEDLLALEQWEQARAALSKARQELGEARELKEIESRLEELEEAARIDRLLSQGRDLMAQGEWEEARSLLKEALDTTLDKSPLEKLLDEIEAELDRQEKGKARAEALATVGALLDGGDWNAAAVTLAEARPRFGESQELKALETRTDELRRRARTQELLAQGQALAAKEQWEEAAAVLRQAADEAPAAMEDPARELLDAALAGLHRQRQAEARAQAQAETLSRIEALLERQQWEPAAEALTQAEEELGTFPELLKLRDRLQGAKRAARVEELLAEAGARLEAGEPQEATVLLDEAGRLDARNQAVRDLAEKAQEELRRRAEEERRKAEEKRRRRIRQAAAKIEGLIDKGDLEAARRALDEAIQQLEGATELSRLDPQLRALEQSKRIKTLRSKARQELRAGDLDTAQATVREAQRIDPEDQKTLALQATVEEHIEERRRQRAVAAEAAKIARLLDRGKARRAEKRLRAAAARHGEDEAFRKLGSRLDAWRAERPESSRPRNRTALVAGLVAGVLLIAAAAVWLRPSPSPGPVSAAGLLVLDAIPWAQITSVVDSQGKTADLGDPPGAEVYTPRALSLPQGEYRITLVHPNYSEPRTITVQVTADETQQELVRFNEQVDLDAYFQKLGW